ncbi:MAG: hypothetical protein BGO95_10700 [Micrococcales bacterium 73-13]|nr:MAG: hypothetical protein BGO95_10700 [Micrococcales bacterium 73-13]
MSINTLPTSDDGEGAIPIALAADNTTPVDPPETTGTHAVTVRIHRIQTTTIDLDTPLDPDADLDQQFEATGAWDTLAARLHEDTQIVSISLLPAPVPVWPGDPYVLVEGGLVQNEPILPMFDLDVLNADFIVDDDLAYRARAYGLTGIAARLDRFAND